MQHYNPIISIIIPSYNKENYLGDCLASCINQTYKEIEIIIVDDFSKDNGLSLADNILKQSATSYKIIKHEINKGLSASRNTGIRNSLGKYIFFLDADDTIDSNLLEKQLSVIKSDNSLHIAPFATFRRFRNIQELKNPTFKKKLKTESACDLCKKNHHYYACGVLLDRSIIEKYDIFFREDIKKHEDIIFLAEYLSYVQKGTLVESSYNYRITPNSITSQCGHTDRINVLYDIYYLIQKSTISDASSIATFARILRNGIFLHKEYSFDYGAIKELPHIPLRRIIHSKMPLAKKMLESLLSIAIIEYFVYRLLRLIVKV